MKNINERFLEAMELVGVNGYIIHKETGKSESTITNIRKGNTKPSTDLIEWLLHNYEAISAEYLMRGEGQVKRIPVEKEIRTVSMQLGEMYQEFKNRKSIQRPIKKADNPESER